MGTRDDRHADAFACESCGQENPLGARFCNGCGSEIGSSTNAGEERKVVSVLFCDRVGFTASSHNADPEDVSRDLGQYHAAARREIERFGGVVEKFIGDAVVGVWGAPVVYEDDAERAVRAALRIIDSVGVDVRVAVNTGEAMVKLAPGVDPGEGVIGDVANTASRLQGFAEVGSVLVGEATVRASAGSIEYEKLAPVLVKGKPNPLPVWRAVSVADISIDRGARPGSGFVGRARELRLLQDLFDRVVADSGLQLITLVGEPGIGKSRLVWEFERWLRDRTEPVTCRRGRCLAYGDGVGFWPLSEIVKAQFGLRETDDGVRAAKLLRVAVDGMTDAAWLRTRLAPLVGLSADAGDREEIFAGWSRFFDEVAARAPLVLVVEDLHWADSGMLGFVRYLAEWSTGVPMLVVCTARPELFETHPEWAGGLVNATTLAVRPLAAAETALLAQSLLGEVAASTRGSILVDSCGGNPLFAEEYARLLAERTTEAVEQLEMPSTVQALIAARIDTLSGHRKALLQDAAVIGRVFWAGAVAKVGARDPNQVHADLHELARKELVRRARTSTPPRDEEYSFWPAPVHQVAYEQIPRLTRAEKHRRTAEWIEAVGGERLADRAELLAFHYTEALRLTRASGRNDEEALRSAAVHWLAMAAWGAADLEHLEHLVREGLGLSREDDPDRGGMLCLLAECMFQAGHNDEAQSYLGEARRRAEEADDVQTLGEVAFRALTIEWAVSAGDVARDGIHRAIARLEREPPSFHLARVLGHAACIEMMDEDFPMALRFADRALTVAEAVDDQLATAWALQWRGCTHALTGESDGLDDLERAADMLTETGSALAPMGKDQLAVANLLWYGPGPAQRWSLEGIEHARRTHAVYWGMWLRAESLWSLADSGNWDALLRVADDVLVWERKQGLTQVSLLAAPQKARVLALRGDVGAARSTIEPFVDPARVANDPQILAPTLGALALIELTDGNRAGARAAVGELGHAATSPLAPIADICRTLVASGSVDDARRLVSRIACRPPRTQHAITSCEAMLAEADGDHARALGVYELAAQEWRTFGNPFESAHALAGYARCEEALGRPADSEGARDEATAIFERLQVSDWARSVAMTG